MTHDAHPSITVNVDITNPGQFFACCGLLELADRLWPGAEGWFRHHTFRVSCDGSLHELLDALAMNRPREVTRLEYNGLEIKPIIAALCFSWGSPTASSLTLGCLDQDPKRPRCPLCDRQSTMERSGPASRRRLAYGVRSVKFCCRSCQQSHLMTCKTSSISGCFQKGRFGFDPGSAWNALDAGFSPNEQNMLVASSPAVELLAAIGIQRFRPIVSKDCESFAYSTWSQPLAPAVAAAAMCGAISSDRSVLLNAPVVTRGQYAALGVSFPICEGASDE